MHNEKKIISYCVKVKVHAIKSQGATGAKRTSTVYGFITIQPQEKFSLVILRSSSSKKSWNDLEEEDVETNRGLFTGHTPKFHPTEP